VPVTFNGLRNAFLCYRYANISYAAARHAAYVGQCAASLFLRVFHFRHRWSPTVGGHPQTAMLSETVAERQLSQVSVCDPMNPHHAISIPLQEDSLSQRLCCTIRNCSAHRKLTTICKISSIKTLQQSTVFRLTQLHIIALCCMTFISTLFFRLLFIIRLISAWSLRYVRKSR
jgi:hypothetical protein